MANNSKSVEKLLVQIRADLKDLKNLQLELKNVRKEGNDAAASISEGFKNALGSIAAGFTTLRIKGIFDNAVADANRLEKTMLGLQATAKLTGNSFSQIKNAVTNLSKDGVLSIDQASQSMKVLLAQGVAADKAFQLVDAAKKVGAFNNIVGDTGQAVQDFIKFLQTGSAELAENLDPSLVKVVKSLGGYEAVANNAAAKQKLINAVIEKGSALTGDYEKFLQSGSQASVTFDKAQERLAQTFGEKLAPAYANARSLGAKLLNGITEIISGLSSFSVSVVSFSALGVAAFASLGGAAVAYGFVSKAAFLSILGPVGAIVGALAALVAVAYELTYVKSTKEIADDYRKQKEEVNGLASSIENLSKIRNRTVSQERELRDSLEQLREKLKAAGIDYDTLAAKTKNYADFVKAVPSELRTKKAADIAEQVKSTEDNLKILEEAVRISEQYYARQGLSISQNVPLVNAEGVNRGIGTYGNTRDAIEKLRARRDSQVLDQAAVLTEEKNKAAASASAVSGPAKPEFRFTEARDELKKLTDEYIAYTKTVDIKEKSALATNERRRKASEERPIGQKAYDLATNAPQFRDREQLIKDIASDKRAEAAEKIDNAREASLGKYRQQYAEFIEDSYHAEIEKIEQSRRAARESAYQIYNEEVRIAGDDDGQIIAARKKLLNSIAKVESVAFAKTVKAGIDSANQTLSAANDIAGGVLDFKNAQSFSAQSKGVGKSLKGAGAIANQAGAPEAGVILQASGQIAETVGGLYDTFAGLFGKSDADRAAEAQLQKERDEQAQRLLQQQSEYQKRMLAIQEANAKLPFENLQRQLRLIDIKAQSDKIAGKDASTVDTERLASRSAAIQSTLQSQRGAIAGGEFFNNVVADPEGLTKFLTERAAQDQYVQAFMAWANAALGDVGSIEELQNYYNQMASVSGSVPGKLASAGLSAVKAKIDNFWQKAADIQQDSITGNTTYENRRAFLREKILASNYGVGGIGVDRDNKNFYDIGRVGDNGLNAINKLGAEIAADTAVADNILSVIEQGNQTNLEIQDNTAQTAANTAKLTQIDDRKFSYLDLGQKRVISKGFNVSVDRLKLPDAVSSTVLSASSTSAPSDTLSAFRRMIDLAEEANDYLAMIAANTDSKASTNTSDFESLLIAKIADIRTRRIGKAA